MRRPLGLLLAGALLVGLPLLLLAVLVRGLTDDAPSPWWAAGALAALVALASAATAVPAAQRQAPRALAAAATTGALLLVLSGSLALAVLVLGDAPDGTEARFVLPGLLAAAVSALAFGPARARALRLLPGARRRPEDLLRTFGERASRGVPLTELLGQLCEALRRTLDLASVEVWTGDGTQLDRLLQVPREAQGSVARLDGPALGLLGRTRVAGEGWLRLWLPALLEGRGARAVRVAPAVHDDQVLGLLVATRTHDGAGFGEADEQLLLEVGSRLGVLLHNRRLDADLQAALDDLHRTNAELRASRSRLVAAADAERRRIERDLHDGAQQHLVALAVNLGLATDLVTTDPEAARELLEQTRLDARATVGQLRDLAHGIYPPLLLESGLGQALRALGPRVPYGLVVRTDGLGRHPADVEAALYFCCLEALANAAKHAPGSPVELRAETADGVLVVEVADEGPGLGTGTGSGRQSMRDRMGAVGGSVQWGAGPTGGTVVRLSVPVGTSHG